MCQAERFYNELGRDTYYDYSCDGFDLLYGKHGFIFTDGSVLDIGIGEDHRIVDIEDWTRYSIATYTIYGREADLRVHGYLTYRQAEVFVAMCEAQGIDDIYIDVYDSDGRYLGDMRFEFEIPNPDRLVLLVNDFEG